MANPLWPMTQKARSSSVDKEVNNGDDAGPDANSIRDHGIYHTFVEEFGNAEVPFEPELFESTVKKSMGIDDSDAMPGFRRYAAALRDTQLPFLFQENSGAYFYSTIRLA